MSALPPKADIGTQSRNLCFVPKVDIGTQPLNVRLRGEEQEEEDADVTDTIGGDIENKEEG